MQQRETSAYVPLLVAGLLGASAGSVIMSRGSGKEEPRPAPATRTPRVDDTTEATAEAVWVGRVRPALELVADHRGLSRRPGERERQAALLAAHWRAVAESGDRELAKAARKAADEIEKEPQGGSRRRSSNSSDWRVPPPSKGTRSSGANGRSWWSGRSSSTGREHCWMP